MKSPQSIEKTAFYGRPEIAAGYDEWRFGTAGGRYASARELDGVVEMLSEVNRSGRLLDVPIGTGRLAERLNNAGFAQVFGVDYSPAMLSQARSKLPGIPLARQDAHEISFANDLFDAVISLRFSFHTTRLQQLLLELTRVTKPGGIVVIDTIRWSPRSLMGPFGTRLGGPLVTWRDRDVRLAAGKAGLTVDLAEPLFLLPSFAYRLMPYRAVKAADWLERRVSTRLLSKVLWRLRKTGAPT